MIITASIAIYGAGLSTLQLWWKRRPIIKITSGPSVLSTEMPANIYIKAANHGEKPVTLLMPRLKIVEDEKSLYFLRNVCKANVNFPHALHAGQSCMVHIPMSSIVALLEKYNYSDETEIYAIYESEIGTKFKSNFKISISSMKQFIDKMSDERVAQDYEAIF